MIQFSVKTANRVEMIDITGHLQSLLKETPIGSGVCHVFIPHTTAALTINENADPDVPRDMMAALEKLVPLHDRYRHREGNADAHVKASLLGAQETILIENGRLVLGTWQSVFFCEFDGPRTRQVLVKLVPTP